MPLSLGSNINSLRSQRRLGDATESVRASSERLSSGLRLNRASDDAAAVAIASGLNIDSRVYSQGIRNVNDGLSLLSVAQGALLELSSIAIRQEELSEQAANGVYGAAQRVALDREAQSLSQEYNRIVESTSFNGLRLLDGSMREGLRIQGGYGLEGSVSMELGRQLERRAGDGTFQTAITYRPIGIYQPQLHDFNRDGALDLIAGDEFGTPRITLALGNGDGSFKASTSLGGGLTQGYAVHLGDFNSDSLIDVATFDDTPNALNIFLSNGDGCVRFSRS